MANCPNKNLESWKNLVASRGEDLAYYLWDKYDGNVPESESRESIVKAGLKATNILQSPKAEQFFNSVTKNKISGEFFWKKMQADLGIPKEQIDLMKSFNTENKDELISSLLGNYSYTIEINTAKERTDTIKPYQDFSFNNDLYTTHHRNVYREYYKNNTQITKEKYDKAFKEFRSNKPTQYYSNLTVPGGTNYTEQEIATPAIIPSIKGHAQFATDKGIGWFRSDDKIVSYAGKPIEFSSAEEYEYNKQQGLIDGPIIDGRPTQVKPIQDVKTRRILEVQSDLFQKGRDKKVLTGAGITENLLDSNQNADDLIGQEVEYNGKKYEVIDVEYIQNPSVEYDEQIAKLDLETADGMNGATAFLGEVKPTGKQLFKDNKNEFLQLLNKDNNWVTFFVKSIIQDSAKKGYEKVLFPTGNTASKVEGHATLEEFKKQKQDRIKELENRIASDETITDVNSIPINKFEILDNKGETIGFRKLDGRWNIQYMTGKTAFQEQLATEEQVLKGINKVITNRKEKDRNEINQLKQELERLDKKGFAALRPIFNFYENTVSNILRKQGFKPKLITDEYGNTWNEIQIVSEREQEVIFFQSEKSTGPVASPEILDKVKQAAAKMGISIQSLADYAKSTGLSVKSVNGIADLVKGVIALSEGKEDVALTEEVVHIATAILEQTDPQVVTSMISKIDKFKIYKDTLEKYKNNKNYQLPNGKPDIRKIKKEAVDKLITEVIVNDGVVSEQFPELADEKNKSLISVWWNTILDYIRSLYGKTNIDIFESVASKIVKGEIEGTVSDIVDGGVYFQIANDAVDSIYDKYIAEDKKLKLIPAVYDSQGKLIKKRHYTYDGQEVKMSVTEKIKGKSPYERTDAQKVDDDMKKDWGSEGHAFLEKYIGAVWIDKDGYKKANPTYTKIQTKLTPQIQKKLEDFADKLIQSYPTGTRFLLEKKVVNTKVKGMMASTKDFIAIIPTQDGAKLDILDWKFAGIDTDINENIPHFKLKEWDAQMKEYTYIANNYGVKLENIRQARMIPFVAGYSRSIPKDRKSPLLLTTLIVGDPVDQKLNSMFTLAVPTASELTGNPAIDRLLEALRVQYEKLYTSPRSPEEIHIKKQELVQLSIAIRSLHVKLDFAPLANVASTFLNSAKDVLEEFDKIDYMKLSREELENKLKTLLSYTNSGKKFLNLDKVFLTQYPLEGMSAEDKKTLTSLRQYSSSIKGMMEKILDFQKAYTVQLGIAEGVVDEKNANKILDAEKEIGFLAKTFREGTQLSAKIIKLASRLILNSKSAVAIKVGRLVDEFKPILLDLEKEASSRGVSAFDMIGKVTDRGLQLIKKIDSKFWEELRAAKESKDKNFLLANMDLDAYKALADEAIKKGTDSIMKTTFSTDKDQNYDIQELKIKQLKNSLDITSSTFNGYEDYLFGYFFNKTMKDELHLSSEYKEMIKSPAAKKVWDFFTALNERARKAGYLEKEGNSFFPLIEASVIQKLQQGNILDQSLNIVKDLYTATEDEEQGFSKIDPETLKVKKTIPKYFKQTRKSVDQLSKDLNKVGTLWIKTLLEYENAKNLENTLLTLTAVEKSKGSILMENGEIVFDGENPRVDIDNNKNVQILEAIIDDEIYGLSEDISSLGNVGVSGVISKFSKTEESKQDTVVSVKKTIKNADVLVRALAVGLKPLIATANAFGVAFQAYINAGRNYRYREFLANSTKIVTGAGLTTEEKALLHLITPLNEDVSLERRREIAKEKGIISWLGTWSFSDVMMSMNAFPERRLQYANAMSFNDNSMVKDGKIVNIRQYLTKEDNKVKYKMTPSERKALENSFEDRVKELKEKNALSKSVKIEGNNITVEGVSDEELAKYRVKVIEYGRNLNGQMNNDNKAGYRRDTIFTSFMMFKTWIPKQVILRTTDIQKNLELDNWEYGRTRVFLKTLSQLGLRNITKMRDIINGTEEGLRIMDEMLAEKKEQHFRRTGEVLNITEEEFYDLIRTELTNQAKELQLLIGMTAVIFAAGAAIPDDDDSLDDATRNRYKYLMKAMNKIQEELSFYYKPTSAESITKGSLIPSLGLLSKVEKILTSIIKEGYGFAIDDAEMMDKAYPIKYFLNIIPGLAQLQQEVIPLVFPEVSKDMGVRVTSESRRQ